ncbi:MAG: hypothetical protein LBB90_05030 [Tannerella sp.]|nr:hypothetical protein [Tannerella sp.]
MQISMLLADIVFGLSNVFFASVAEGGILSAAGGALFLAFVAGVVAYAGIPASVLANIRRWHGFIDGQFDNIDNLVNTIQASQAKWSPPQALLQQLSDNRDDLAKLIARCRSNYGSAVDRTLPFTTEGQAAGFDRCINEV